MNNIYKVIWSKAKNCYVVASEIARSHTKSASGSEKIGGVARHALLALGAACAIACGGFVNVGAADTVDVTTGGSTATVYTKEGTEFYVAGEIRYLTEHGNVVTNKNNIITLQGKTAGLSADGKSLNSMNNVETDALKVTGQISNGTVTTTLADINESMKQTGDNKTAIDKLNEKTTDISWAAGEGTKISGVTIKDGNIVGNGNSAITQLANVGTDKINGKSLAGTTVATEKEVANAVKAETDARTEADNKLEEKITKNTQDIATLNGKVATAEGNITDLKAKDSDLEKKIQTNANNIKINKDEIARVNGELVKTNDYFNAELGKTNDYFNKELSKTNNHFNTELGKTNAALQATNKRTAGIDRIDATSETTIEKNVKVDNRGNVTAKGNVTADGKLKGEGVDAGTGAITTTGAVNAGSLNVTDASRLKGDVTMDNKLSVTGDTSLGKTDVGGALNVTGKSDLKDNVILGTNAANTVTVNGTANFNAAVNMDKGLTVTNGETNLKKTTVDGDLKVTGTITTDKMVFGDKATNNYTEIDHGKVTSKNLVVNGAGETISSSSTFNAKENKVGFANSATGEQSSHKQTSDMIVDNVKNNITGDQSFHKQTSDVIMDNVKDLHNSNNRTQTKTETKDIITDKDGNSSTTSQTASENKTYLKDKDGKNTNSTIDTAKGYDKTIKGENGETSTKQDELNITNTAQNGTITNDAQNIVNNASGNITNKANTMDTNVTGKATESYGSLDTTVNGNETHIVKGTKTETVDGKVTENYKDGQATNVTGNQDIHVTGKQTNTVEGGQENIISGGQINNITGDQTTTITGNKNETVTENVTEDYKKDLTTTVGGNETHEVKGTKTETVEGKVTENYNGGQETNVTGDQVIKVSGTQTTTATDINRNASSGMIDTIDNDYGTNTETKVAGKTTTDVSIKGTEEKGQYIRGANESRDYLIKGTLKNSETKTVDATSTEITDGKGKTSATIQDVNNLAGSVTNGTETGVSGIHANNDGSVSIDSAVTDGNKYSVINQKKDSIQSAVGDGTNSTVILQDKDNVTIASSNGMVAIGGKDIVNNAQDTITNTAGTKITDTAGDSTVTTEKDKGTTFTKTGSTAYREGGPTDTNISGNTITTGKVTMDYAEVMKDLGVTGKTTTGSLEVKGESKLTGKVTMESDATVGGKLDVTGKATFHNDVDITGDVTARDVTANSYKVGDKTYISAAGINANDQKITNVADGSISEGSKDAVNGGQLYNVKNDLEGKVNKVGANAAAMANLHPMEFDPSSKWNIAAAIGNYGSETAAALGAFYRPNDDVMVNLSTAFGTGENMVGGGVSVRLGKGGNKLSREETNALKAQVADLTARMDALLSVLNPNMSKDFPDVPENHWAYEAVSRLAGNDIVQGYPDGEFHGERTMTRYEMAEIIYNALSRGAEAEKELVEEFKPELQAMAASEKATAERAEG